MSGDVLTIGQLSETLTESCPVAVPTWKARRVVDAIAPNLPRVVNYRVVPKTLIPAIVEELERQGWFDKGATSCSS